MIAPPMSAGFAALLLSALLHAAWNALLKREADPEGSVRGVLAAALAFAAAAALLLPGAGLAGRAGLAWSLAAGLFEGAYFATLAAALARASYGFVYAVARGGALVLVWPAAALLLGEPVTARGAGGAVLVGAGGALVGAAGPAQASRAGTALALACAAAIAGYHLCYGRALAAGASPAPVFAVALAAALPLVWAAGRWRGRGAGPGPGIRPSGRQWLAGAVATASFLLFLDGLARAGAGPALTVRNTAVVFAQAIGWAMGEAVPRRQLLGSLLVLTGAVVLAG